MGELSDEALRETPRTALEAQLRFLGLLLFRNELKPSSAAAIAELKAGGVRTIVLTGDNAQCAHYIARAARITADGATVLVATLEDEPVLPPHKPDGPPVQAVRWRPMADGGDASAAASSLSTAEVEAQLATAAAVAGRRGGRGAGAARSQPGEKTPLIGATPAARPAEEKVAPLLVGVPPPLLELAVASSEALRALMASGAMARLLPHTRIWARTKPEDKAAIVSMFVELGMVSTMVGDGGNDCGALRTAHAGLALSEAEASVVSPFTSCTWSIGSVVDLVREGRAALATAFGSYKFLIIYGQFFAVLKLTCFWYGVILCNAIYLLIDTVTVMGLTAAMALSLPQQRLLPTRPPASLLGARVVSSVLVMQAINVCFFGAQLHAMKTDPDYVRWPSALSVGPSWWELGDNWECTVIFAAVYPPFVAASLAFSIGGAFRRPVLRNFVLVAITAALLCLASLLVLLPSCPLTRVFHIASEQFNTPCPSSCYPADAPVDASLFDYAAADCDACPRNAVWLAYQQPAPFGGGGGPSAAMGFPFRLRLWAASALECVLLVCVELVLGGRGFEALRARLGLRKPNTRPVFVP